MKEIKEITVSPLNPALATIQNQLSAMGLGAPDVLTTDLTVARNKIALQYEYLNADAPKVPYSEDFQFQYLAQTVLVRNYFPNGAGVFKNNTLIIYLHGGGWSFGDNQTHTGIAQAFAHQSGLTLASIDYSLAPEKKYPYQNHQITDVIEQLLNQFEVANGVHLNCILMGDSAGANLAISAYLNVFNAALQSRVSGLVLFYGVYAGEPTSDSWKDLGDGRFGLTVKAMNWYWDQFLSQSSQKNEPMAAPILSPQCALPPVWMMIGDLDPLIDENYAMADKIRASGTSCDLVIAPGFTHGFLRFCHQLKEVQHFIELSVNAMTKMLDTDSIKK